MGTEEQENEAEQKKIGDHSFFRHHHLTFDEEAGRDEFRGVKSRQSFDATALPDGRDGPTVSEDALLWFSQDDGLAPDSGAYTLTEIGRIERLVPLALEGALVRPESNTGDAELDRLIGTAQRKFLAMV